jgi:hypothetical protein
MLACHICGRSTQIKDGFIVGVTLRKDNINPGKYLCENHTPKHLLPWRLKKPSEFRALLSQLGNPGRKKKKIINKIKKVKV